MISRFLIPVTIFLSINSFAQTEASTTNGWHLKDNVTDSFYGISLDKAYEFVKNKKSKTVIVAVIDSGIDTLHEDLKPVLWRNPKEIPNNNKDDDKNGFVDDIFGWNFIGGKNGANVTVDSYERDRVYFKFKNQFENKKINIDSLNKNEKYLYEMWLRAESEKLSAETNSVDMGMLIMLLSTLQESDSTLKNIFKKEIFTGVELNQLKPEDIAVKKAQSVFLNLMKMNNALEATNKEFVDGLSEYIESEKRKTESKTNAPKSYRSDVVADNYSDFNDKNYGNNNVFVDNKSAFHGTHVSGIIAAKRNNNLGIDGIADNVKIMTLRAVPDGDEHDKDIALAIRYAVDNGAQIINMSFGKSFSPEKYWVDEAVEYANKNGVLLVHAAGNDAKNIDSVSNFPNPISQIQNKKATNWITVGASGDNKLGGIVANFSNFGKQEVDVFAPGVKIYSTIPGGNTYGNAQGTSMASPVVAGLAAFVLSYFPNLSAEQLKYVIENSSSVVNTKIIKPDTGVEMNLNEISKTGGIINAYEAIKLAAQLKGERVSKPLKGF